VGERQNAVEIKDGYTDGMIRMRNRKSVGMSKR
jgi:hypothetical protein